MPLLAFFLACWGLSGCGPELQSKNIPDPLVSVADTAKKVSFISEYGAVLQSSTYLNSMKLPGEITVFIPRNEEFLRFLSERKLTSDGLTTDQAMLDQLLMFQIVEGRISAEYLKDQVGKSIRTVAGNELIISLVNGLVAISVPGGTPMILSSTGIETSQGLIHVTNGVLAPAGM